MTNFQTSDEALAFNDVLATPEGSAAYSINDRMAAAWFAARKYFSEDQSGEKESPVLAQGGESGRFDEYRAHTRLEILKTIQPYYSGSTLTNKLEELDKWVHGES